MPSHEDLFTTIEKVEINCNLQFNYEDAGIAHRDEHATVIKEIEDNLFLRDEPQVEHSGLKFKDYEEEMEFLEKWLDKDEGDDSYMKFSDSVDLGRQIIEPYNNGLGEEKIQ